MKAAAVPIDLRRGAPVSGAVAASSAVYSGLEGAGVTFFGGPNIACAVYMGRFWSLLITLDAVFLAAMADETSLTDDHTVSIENGTNGWAGVIASIMLGMDVLVLVTQAVICTSSTSGSGRSPRSLGSVSSTARALRRRCLGWCSTTRLPTRRSVTYTSLLRCFLSPHTPSSSHRSSR